MRARAKRLPRLSRRAIDSIDVPTMLVAGDEDAIAPVQVARDMAGGSAMRK